MHFPRYDATKPTEALLFQSVLWALQRQLPVEKEPLLVENHWEFLYARSTGCIGHLKRKAQKAAETTTLVSEDDSSSRPRRRRGKPGDRNPGRDKTGEHVYEGDDALADDTDEEEAAG